jgi:hypothetical protein
MSRHSAHGVLVVSLLVCCCGLRAVPHRHQPGKGAKVVSQMDKEGAGVRISTKAFLTSWLVERNDAKALQSFSDQAYSNRVMLHESCAGYIKDADRRSRDGIKKGIQKFLADASSLHHAKTLNEALNLTVVLKLAQQLEGKVTNNVKEDGFLLVHSSSVDAIDLATEPEASAFLKAHLPPQGFYEAFVPLGQGMSVFLWIKEGDAWKIYHVALVCM